ncbi:glycosyltransferase family 4 protein [Nonomuraea sp. NPDC048881]|uniref:glycosyltransferase family 4 protein n=1 Tax=Nonomuraea sp. NPDC048881 TaxID=3155030 RepID=UPI0033D61899
MKIAMISPVWLRTPPVAYGAVESLVSLLVEELVARGHDVTLYASGDSITTAKLRSYHDRAPGWDNAAQNGLFELMHVLTAYQDIEEFDVVHDHSDPLGPAIGAYANTIRPVVHTVHGPPASRWYRPIYTAIHRRINLVAISRAQQLVSPELRYADMIHHGLPLDRFSFSEEKDDYTFYIGRMDAAKGLHLAIEATRKAGRKLVVATKAVESEAERAYFEDVVTPLLGPDVELVGEVGFAEKVELYKHAACTIVPTNWEEPFGLTAIESLACGTPVVALRRGATAEIVKQGVNGYLADDPAQMAVFIDRADEISALDCRRDAESRFSLSLMVDRHEQLYRRLESSHGS